MHIPSRKYIYIGLSGLILLAVVALLVGAGSLPGARAQDQVQATPSPFFIEPGPDMNLIPSNFKKTSPNNGSTITGNSVLLQWQTQTASPVITGYLHCIDKTNNGVCDGNLWTYNSDNNRGIGNLDPGSTYYWQVMACNGAVVDGGDQGGCVGADTGKWWSFTVPPVLYASTGAQDGWILESGQGTGIGGSMSSTSTTLILGDDASNRQYRSILSFDTSSLPDNSTITSAKIRIYQSGSPSGTNPFSALGNLNVSIQKGFYSTLSSLQLSDFNASSSASNVATFGATPVSGWYTATMTTGFSNINKGGLTQFRLAFGTATNANNVADFMRFVSGDGGGNKPQLYITYNLPQ